MHQASKDAAYHRLLDGGVDEEALKARRQSQSRDYHDSSVSQEDQDGMEPWRPSESPVVHHSESRNELTQKQSEDIETRNHSVETSLQEIPSEEVNHGPLPSKTFAAHRRRMNTNLEDIPIEIRHTQDFLFRRPRPLLVEHQGHVLDIGEHGKLDAKRPELSYNLEKTSRQRQEHHPNSLNKQRERMDLFVDLVWVGIISNISEHFFSRVFKQEADIGAAVGEFILLFVPAFRIWICLQQWLNSYYMDDYFQRFFVVWIMILGLIWGNNAPFLLESFDSGDNFVIVTYIVALSSFIVAQLIYSHWLPWLRWSLLIGFIASIPGIAFWVALAVTSNSFDKYMLLMAAVIYSLVETFFFSCPLADRLLGSEIRKTQDNRTMIKRYENFFVIALGEGVFLLIRESPLGLGLQEGLSRGIQALLIYYFLNWTYFHGDVSKKFIHPIDRRWWVKLLWQWLHTPLFASLVLLSSGTLFLVEYTTSNNEAAAEPETALASEGTILQRRLQALQRSDGSETETIKFDDRNFKVAMATTFISVAIALSSQLGMALLCRSVDEPHTLLVNNSLVRMAPRGVAIAVLSTIWLVDFTDPNEVLGIALAIVASTMGLEQLMGMPKHARIFEPKEAALAPVISMQSL